jgi:hypothetical protein
LNFGDEQPANSPAIRISVMTIRIFNRYGLVISTRLSRQLPKTWANRHPSISAPKYLLEHFGK